MAEPRYWAVIPAAGAGVRFGSGIPKQYQPLAGRTVIEWAMRPLLDHPRIQGLVVAIAAGDQRWSGITVRSAKRVWSVEGGGERVDSVRHALNDLAGEAGADDWVLVHDAARPCLPRADLDLLIRSVSSDAVGGLLAAPVADTLKLGDGEDRVTGTLDRRGVWRALTPQMFRLGLLREALARAPDEPATDESMAMEAAGHRPLLVPGAPDNIKITTGADLQRAERLLR